MLELIKSIVDYVFGLKKSNAALLKQVKDLTNQATAQADDIARLTSQVAADEVDDASLKKAADDARAQADAAEARAVQLQAELDAINAQAPSIIAALNDNPETPSVDEEFKVVGQ